MTTAYTLDQYQILTQAIAAGQTRVRYGDREVQYGTTSELLRVKAQMEAELIAAGLLASPVAGGIVRGGTTYAEYCGG